MILVIYMRDILSGIRYDAVIYICIYMLEDYITIRLKVFIYCF